MKSLLAIASFYLCASTAMAQVQFIDTPGVAHFLRDEENAAIMISDKAVEKITAYIAESENQNPPVVCKKGYCTIGQIDRSGRVALLKGEFAKPDFFKRILKMKTKPNGLVDLLWFNDYATSAVVYPNQCQSPNRLRLQTLNVDIEGIAAEQLYNFLSIAEKETDRSTSVSKESPDQLFSCEKTAHYDPADYNRETGSIPETARPSYTKYSCSFRILKSGNLATIIPCHIYGASSSAGGGGR